MLQPNLGKQHRHLIQGIHKEHLLKLDLHLLDSFVQWTLGLH